MQCYLEWSAAVHHSSTTAGAERRRTSIYRIVAPWPWTFRPEGASLVTCAV